MGEWMGGYFINHNMKQYLQIKEIQWKGRPNRRNTPSNLVAQNQKYITYRNAIRGPRHGHSLHTQKMWWKFGHVVCDIFERTDKQTDKYGTMRHVRSGKNTRIFFPLTPKVWEIGDPKGLHGSEDRYIPADQIWLW